MTNTASFKKH